MKNLICGRRLKKSKSVEGRRSHMNGSTYIPSSRTFDQTMAGTSRDHSATDESHSNFDGASCSTDERLHLQDNELDKHVMKCIADVKYINKRPKFTAVGEVNFQRDSLDAHNLIRARYGCQPLVWSEELCDLAHSWAVKLSEKGRILFPEIEGIGENIHLSVVDEHSHLPSGDEITELWANEVEYLDFMRPRWQQNCQHFTQMIWKATTEMGIARCWNTTKNCVAVVAFYRPAGNSNIPGEFQVNVPSKASMDDIPNYPGSPSRNLLTNIKRSVTISDSGVQCSPVSHRS